MLAARDQGRNKRRRSQDYASDAGTNSLQLRRNGNAGSMDQDSGSWEGATIDIPRTKYVERRKGAVADQRDESTRPPGLATVREHWVQGMLDFILVV